MCFVSLFFKSSFFTGKVPTVTEDYLELILRYTQTSLTLKNQSVRYRLLFSILKPMVILNLHWGLPGPPLLLATVIAVFEICRTTGRLSLTVQADETWQPRTAGSWRE